MTEHVIAALQIGASYEGTSVTLSKIMSYEAEIAGAGCSVVVLPEAVLGGYPKGSDFGTRLGFRLPEGRVQFGDYHSQAIDIPGPELAALEQLASRTGAYLVVGVIERDGATLYCTALYLDPERGLIGRRRKLMPTATERSIWGRGSGSDLAVVHTDFAVIGAAICWENYMPLLRHCLQAKGVEIWCAPTVDERESWQCTMRHVAAEGRCFVLSACQMQPSPAALGLEIPDWDPQRPLIRGGSVIVSPLGDVLAGPLFGQEGLITAKVDLSEIIRAKYDFDVVGHYARPDIFTLTVDDTPKPVVRFLSNDSVSVLGDNVLANDALDSNSH